MTHCVKHDSFCFLSSSSCSSRTMVLKLDCTLVIYSFYTHILVSPWNRNNLISLDCLSVSNTHLLFPGTDSGFSQFVPFPLFPSFPLPVSSSHFVLLWPLSSYTSSYFLSRILFILSCLFDSPPVHDLLSRQLLHGHPMKICLTESNRQTFFLLHPNRIDNNSNNDVSVTLTNIGGKKMLVFKNPKAEDEGTYICKGRFQNTHLETQVNIRVYGMFTLLRLSWDL